MNNSQAALLVHDLLINVSLMLSMTVCYSYARPLLKRTRTYWHPFIEGSIFGLFGIIVMSSPMALTTGVFFDGRGLMIAVAGAFGGLRASLVAATFIIVARLSMGGPAAPHAVAAALTVVALTYLLLGRGRRREYPTFTARPLLVLGLDIALNTNFWTMLVSPEVAQSVLTTLALPMVLLFPPAMLLIGKVLSNQNQRFALEEALQTNDQMFRQLSENLDHVVWIEDCQSRSALYVSPMYERLTGRPAEQLYQNIADLLAPVHPDDRDRVLAAAAQTVLGGFDEEFRYLLPDGSVRWVSAQTYPIHNSHGDVYRIAGMAKDITAHKAAEAHKLELETERARVAMLRDFIDSGSHDLRTPLTVMQTSLYLLRRTAADPRQHGYIAQLQQQADRMQAMIENMLTLTRLDAASGKRNPVPTDLNALVELAVAPSRSRLKAGQKLDLSLDASMPVALCGPSDVELALTQVLSNAITFTPAGRSIEVRTAQDDDAVVIEIRDEGVGIPKAELPNIFERFYRVDKARGADTGGSGLGLAIAQKALQFCDGRIEAESHVDSGSIFRIVLRAAPANAVVEREPEAMMMMC